MGGMGGMGMGGMGGMSGMGGMGSMGGMGMMGAMGAVASADDAGGRGADGAESAEDAAQQKQQEYTKAMARIKAGPGALLDDSDDEAYSSSRPVDSSHPNYRPPGAEKVPGLTDKRFDGYIHFWHKEQGYGFIKSQQLSKRFPNHDIFLHKNQKGSKEEGDHVSFGVFLNFRGKPQATELRRPKA